MSIGHFNGADTSPIIGALLRGCAPEEIVSIQFAADVPPARSMDPQNQWRRFRAIVACEQVYDAFGISTVPVESKAPIYYATGLETIGTIANLLMRGGIHQQFVDDVDSALTLSRTFLDHALLRNYDFVEAYSIHEPWCDWFIGEGIMDKTVLLGHGTEWWLLSITGTD